MPPALPRGRHAGGVGLPGGLLLGLDALRRLAASIKRYLDGDVAVPLGAQGGPLEVESSRPLGAVWLLDGLWKQLGMDAALARQAATSTSATTYA